jgi:hypothetical protein
LFSKGEKWFDKLLNVKYLHLFHHFKAIYQFPKHIIFLEHLSLFLKMNMRIGVFLTGFGNLRLIGQQMLTLSENLVSNISLINSCYLHLTWDLWFWEHHIVFLMHVYIRPASWSNFRYQTCHTTRASQYNVQSVGSAVSIWVNVFSAHSFDSYIFLTFN